jgi:DEAD/DEAH box helicase domain-containing protein
VTRADPLAVLVAGGRRAGRLAHVERIPARPATTVPWPSWADDAVVHGYRTLGVADPWRHQVEAAEELWRGRHVVLATSTGSGKSLAAWLPALSAVREASRGASGAARGRISTLARRPSTLYLSPTKALAADQLTGLERLLGAAGLRDVRAATCDGDTPLDERDWVRDHADLVLTNPDFLHFSLLPGHRRWQRVLRSLRYVVLDECHAYRGVLGAHVALVLRRLLRLARHYGAQPTVFLASATTGAPAATAARLIGVGDGEVTAVVDDASPSGERTVALWVPPLSGRPAALPAPWDADDGHEDAGPRRSAVVETAELLADLVATGHRTLAFARARASTEVVAERAREHLGPTTALARRVAAYRGGYLPEERRALEQAIRTGDLLALATTNALELGVDLSGLDAVLIAGWPGTRASLWQQAGRSGRAGADGLAVLVASDNPLDAYLVRHPEAIFGTPVESTTFDPANPYVLAPHLCAAAAELPLRAADAAPFGLEDSALLDELARRGLLRRRADGWYWNHARAEDPSRLTDLRGSGTEATVQIVEHGTGRLLGTVDAPRADVTVHPGAVYVHQGRTFVVDALEDDVALAREDPHLTYRTRAQASKRVTILRTRRELDWGDVRWGFGTVELTSRVTAYQRLRPPSMATLGTFPLDRPERRLRTSAVWWTVTPAALEEAGIRHADLPGALHAAEHAAIGLLPLVATCDRWDIGGLSTALHEQTLLPTVFVYDGLPGGAGFAERGFAAAAGWLRATRDAIAACGCADGCPACVQSPKCGNNNSPLAKEAARRLLTLALRHERSTRVACPIQVVPVA